MDEVERENLEASRRRAQAAKTWTLRAKKKVYDFKLKTGRFELWPVRIVSSTYPVPMFRFSVERDRDEEVYINQTRYYWLWCGLSIIEEWPTCKGSERRNRAVPKK